MPDSRGEPRPGAHVERRAHPRARRETCRRRCPRRSTARSARTSRSGAPSTPPARASVQQRRARSCRAPLQQPEPHQALGGGDDGLLVRARRPAEQAPGLLAGGVLRPCRARAGSASPPDRAARRAAPASSGSCRVGTRLAAAPRRAFSTLAISSIDMKSPATARKRSPLAGGIGHRAEVQVGDVAHVDDAEVEPRAAGHRAVHQALHQQDRASNSRARAPGRTRRPG